MVKIEPLIVLIIGITVAPLVSCIRLYLEPVFIFLLNVILIGWFPITLAAVFTGFVLINLMVRLW